MSFQLLILQIIKTNNLQRRCKIVSFTAWQVPAIHFEHTSIKYCPNQFTTRDRNQFRCHKVFCNRLYKAKSGFTKLWEKVQSMRLCSLMYSRFTTSNHLFPKHTRWICQNSLYPYDTLGWTLCTYINLHDNIPRSFDAKLFTDLMQLQLPKQ